MAEALAGRVDVPLDRVLAWTAIKTVHQAAQAWRDDQHDLERLVESSAISALLRSAQR